MKERFLRLGDWTGHRGRSLFRHRPKVALSALVFVGVLFWTAGLSAAWMGYDIALALPEREAIGGIGRMDQATTIFDRHDKPVFTIFKEQRLEIGLEDVSPNVIKAVLSAEDQRFYAHEGVDFRRILAAIVRNVREWRKAEGGSTVTQQLARTSFLSTDKTYRRKLKEMVLAAQIENTYTKDEILALYLNKVYFGDGLYGIEAAARGYFSTPAKDLSIAESALLIGLIKSPSTWAPTINMERAVSRRNVVLETMVDSGNITREEYDRARKEPVKLKDGLSIHESFGLYYKEQVRLLLVEQFGWERVYQGGLKVYTALEPDMQQAAEKHVEEWLAQLESRRNFRHPTRKEALKGWSPEKGAPDYLQGALMAADPRTGEVRALVGGRSFRESRFNRAVQAKRQAGSAFKPFVYAAALEHGASPGTIIANLDMPTATPQGAWVPEDEHSSGSSMTMRRALRTSSNRAAVQMINSVGVRTAVEYAKKLELGDQPAVPSMALGAGDVTLDAMTMAFGAFANGGLVRDPLFIRKVVDRDGKVLFEAKDAPRRAIEEATAFFMSDMLAEVINHGTAYGARREGFTLPAAGKTGTTNEYRDGWFVGYTPSLVAGVWVGFDKPRTIFNGGYAAQVAVPIWARFMRDATRGNKPEWFERPKDIVGVAICSVSGKLATDGCRAGEITYDDLGNPVQRSFVVTQYYRKGVAPTEYCDLHGGYHSPSVPVSPVYGAPVLAPPPGTPDPSAPVAPPPGTPDPNPPPVVRPKPGDPATPTVADPKREEDRPSIWRRIFRGNAKTAEQIKAEEDRKQREADRKAKEAERREAAQEKRRAEQEKKKKAPPPKPPPPTCCLPAM
ncbi:MAG: PBP1A family penicillin-binding protein [Vicinamibacterales bacterium]